MQVHAFRSRIRLSRRHGLIAVACRAAHAAGQLPCWVALELLQAFSSQRTLSMIAEGFPPQLEAATMEISGVAPRVARDSEPLLSSCFSGNHSWLWLFLINIPVEIGRFLAAARAVDDP